MSEHADIIREGLDCGLPLLHREDRLARRAKAESALVALEAELAEARRERDEARAGIKLIEDAAYRMTDKRDEQMARAEAAEARAVAAEAKNARLKAALEPFASRGMGLPMAWWGYVEAARAAFASGSEGDTRG